MFKAEKPVSFGLIVGLGAAASAALAALYVLYKKDEEDFELDPRLDQPSAFQTIRSTTVRKVVPKEAAGAVIGRGGEVIRQVQKKTNTRITFISGPPGPADESDRVIAIRGSSQDVIEADEMIDNIIQQALLIECDKIHIESHEVGLIIGRSGATIKAISEESGAKVNVPRSSRGTRAGRVAIEIRGTSQQISSACKLIDDKLRLSRLTKSNNYKNYNCYGNQAVETSHRPSQTFTPFPCNINSINGPQIYEKLEATLDSGCVDVYVSSVQSPSKFWVQPYGSKSIDLDRLLVEMTEFYEKLENLKLAKLESFKLGDIVAAPLQGDEHWFRVKIVGIVNESSEESEVTVFYLDFGDESTLLKSQLYALNETFLFKLPFQALECSLNGVIPFDDEWSNEAIDYFKKLTRATLWEKILAKPVKIASIDDGRQEHYTVDLIDIKNDNDIMIAQELIAKNYAQTTPSN